VRWTDGTTLQYIAAVSGFSEYRPNRRFQPYVAISPDGIRVAYSDDRSGQFNLVVSRLDGGPDEELTHYDDITVREAVWTPDGQRLFFVADRNGDEQYQLYVVDAVGGTIDALTADDSVQYQLGTVSPDGRYLSFVANDRSESDQDILVRDLESGATTRIYAAGGMTYPAAWAPDSRRLIGVRYFGPRLGVLYLLDLNGEPQQILPPEGEPEAFIEPGPWLPDGGGFLLRTDADRDFVGVATYDLNSCDLRDVITPDWDVEHVGLAADGATVVWIVNENGTSQLHAAEYDASGCGAEVVTPTLPAGPVGSFSLDDAGTTAAVLLSTGLRPTNVAVAVFPTQSARWITHAWAKAKGVTEPTLVQVQAYDGRTIPAWLYRPAGDGPHPIVLSVHGGPEGQEQPGYNYGGLYHYLLPQGSVSSHRTSGVRPATAASTSA